jgi:ribosomal protein S18 acetylase RimI-like enzyme
MVEIRSIQFSELETLRKIAIDTYWDTFADSTTLENNQKFVDEAYTLKQFAKELEEPNTQYYMAWEGDQAAGYMRLRLSNEVERELGTNTIELQRLYVHPHFQGKKIGVKLIELALGYALEHKFEWIWLGVWEFNYRAQAFYKKFGFERFGEHVFQVGNDPQIDWLLRKRLIE